MRKIREVLRLRFQQGLGHPQIAGSCGIGADTVSDYLKRARAANVGWAEAQPLSDAELEARVFPQPQHSPVLERAPVDFRWVHRELRRPWRKPRASCSRRRPATNFSFDDKLGLVVDREWSERDDRRVARRIRKRTSL
jgi:hypothetical protein